MFVRYILLGVALTAPNKSGGSMFVRHILLLGLALAAPASAAPIDPGRATPSSNRNEATEAGNPLSKIPLSALTATRDRPLFSLSCRPPTPAIEANAEPAQAPAARGSAGAAGCEVDRNHPQPRDERCAC